MRGAQGDWNKLHFVALLETCPCCLCFRRSQSNLNYALLCVAAFWVLSQSMALSKHRMYTQFQANGLGLASDQVWLLGAPYCQPCSGETGMLIRGRFIRLWFSSWVELHPQTNWAALGRGNSGQFMPTQELSGFWSCRRALATGCPCSLKYHCKGSSCLAVQILLKTQLILPIWILFWYHK